MNKTIILTLLTTLALAACSPVYTGPTSAPKVAMVGDSITLQSAESVQVAFYGKRLAIMAENGIDLSAGRTKFIQPAVKSKPAVLVIELGVNSAKDGWTSADLIPLEGIMSDVASVPCVVWVTPSSLKPSDFDGFGPGYIQDRLDAMAASIAKRVPRHPNMHLANYGTTERLHPELFVADGLHPSRQGQDAYAMYLSTQVDKLCPA
jgi:hypothetical protein